MKNKLTFKQTVILLLVVGAILVGMMGSDQADSFVSIAILVWIFA